MHNNLWMGRQVHYIRQWRLAKHLVQQQLADRIGKHKSIISKLENFKIDYTQEHIELISEALGIEPASLLRHPDQEKNWHDARVAMLRAAGIMDDEAATPAPNPKRRRRTA